MTECLALVLWFQNRIFGIDWHPWKVIGWVGNIIFFSRFFVQWWATERNKQVVIPNSFWWLSLVGSLCLLAYGLWRRDSVFIFAYLFTWIPYVRNLVISHRVEKARPECNNCDMHCPPDARFCPSCGQSLNALPPE
jgi:lipid-A-disaccharide synthase-like uncharacterized protein